MLFNMVAAGTNLPRLFRARKLLVGFFRAVLPLDLDDELSLAGAFGNVDCYVSIYMQLDMSFTSLFLRIYKVNLHLNWS